MANTGAGFGDENYESFGLEPLVPYGTGRTRGVELSVQKKLSNERFVNNAPEKVIAIERQKLADAEAKIETLEKSLASLG